MNYEKGQLSRCADTYHYHDSTEGSANGTYLQAALHPSCISKKNNRQAND